MLLLGRDGYELACVFAEVYQFAYHARRHALVLWLGVEEYGVYTAYLSVDVGLLALVLEVFDASHALDDELGSLATGEVDGEVVV